MTKKRRKDDPTTGGRFKRAAPSGTYRGHPSNGKTLDRRNGETACTPELIEKIVKLTLAGNYIEVSARANGVAGDTLRQWLIRGGKGEEPYAALARAVHDAAAQSEAMDVANIAKLSMKDWRASAWRLERKHAKRWGRRDSLEITGDDDKPLAVVHGRIDPTKLSPEKKAQLKALMEEMRTDKDEDGEESSKE